MGYTALMWSTTHTDSSCIEDLLSGLFFIILVNNPNINKAKVLLQKLEMIDQYQVRLIYMHKDIF